MSVAFGNTTFQVVFIAGQQDKCFLCGQVGHLASNCEGKAKRKAGELDEKGDAVAVAKKPYQVRILPYICGGIYKRILEVIIFSKSLSLKTSQLCNEYNSEPHLFLPLTGDTK